MVRHIVCFKLKDNSFKAKEEAKKILLSMKGKVPLLVNIEVGCDYLCSERSYDVVLITDFNSKEDAQAYQNDEYHCSVVKKHMHSVAESSIAIDYEISDV